jgi:hypothetical protein
MAIPSFYLKYKYKSMFFVYYLVLYFVLQATEQKMIFYSSQQAAIFSITKGLFINNKKYNLVR